MSKPESSITTYHAAGQSILGNPFCIGISSFNDFHWVKTIVSANILFLCGVKRLDKSMLEKCIEQTSSM
jgi:hypothetical protein